MKTFAFLTAAFAASALAKDGRTFAVLHFYGDGALVESRMDPIVSPGNVSSHVHTIMGGNAFSETATGEDLMASTCSNALVVGDNSAYWTEKLYFHDKAAGTFEPVELFYMNVYYFFEGTNDKIQAFPVGLQMVSGTQSLRTCPNAGGAINQDPSQGPIQPTQVTCPRSSFDPPSWPVGSDGSKAGIQDPNNKGSGQGFPFAKCNGYASPMRMDLHFPSCYNPAAGLTDYKNNMQFPTDAGNGKSDCPTGWIHTPHLFYEVYWNTPKFDGRWDVDNNEQPFVLANGDLTGCSHHGDFLAAWDTTVLQNIIDTCDEGDTGMDKCAGVQVRDNSKTCNIVSPNTEAITGVLKALPGNNPIAGWGVGDVSTGGSTPAPVVSSVASSVAASSSSKPAATSSAAAVASSSAVVISSSKVVLTTLATKAQTSAAASVVVSAASSSASASAPATTAAPTTLTDGDTTSTVLETTYVTATTTIYSDEPEPTTTSAPSTGSGNSSSLPDIAGWKYAGCYTDASTRVIIGDKFPVLAGGTTMSKCVAHCVSISYTVAGTENGGQCFCGNEVAAPATPAAEGKCAMPCDGSAEEVCGGAWALSVYSVDGGVKRRSVVVAAVAEEVEKKDVHVPHLLRHRSRRS